MKQNALLTLLRDHKGALEQQFGITELAVFGSCAHGSASAESDLDVLVDFDGPANSRRYFGVQFYLEDLTGRSVDLVTRRALRAELRPHVEREAVHV